MDRPDEREAPAPTPQGVSESASTTQWELRVDGLSRRGSHGWVYRGVDLRAGRGTVVALRGPRGSGRTSLLLTLAGRMRPDGGAAEVCGLALPRRARRLRRVAALGPVPGVNELEPALSVAEHLRERRWLQRRDGRRPVAEALALAGLDPDRMATGPRTLVRDLDAREELQLGLALALLGRPRLLCLDEPPELDAGTWQLLRSVAEDGTTVVVAVPAAADDAERYADVVVDLPRQRPGAEEPAPPPNPGPGVPAQAPAEAGGGGGGKAEAPAGPAAPAVHSSGTGVRHA